MTREELLFVAKPILFNTEMVRAILDGRKSATRRKIRVPNYGYFMFEPPRVKPPYKIGDILYVRETWSYGAGKIIHTRPQFSELPHGYKGYAGARYYYRANEFDYELAPLIKWCPSIHMPREAARIFLRVTGVRAERLQEITEEQAKAEGIRNYWAEPHDDIPVFLGAKKIHSSRRKAYSGVWDSTLKKSDIARYSWDANPWVWVIEFEKLKVDA